MNLSDEQKKIIFKTFLHLKSYGKSKGSYTISVELGDVMEGQKYFETPLWSEISCPIPEYFKNFCNEIFENYIDDSIDDDGRTNVYFQINTDNKTFDIEIEEREFLEERFSKSFLYSDLDDEVQEVLHALKHIEVRKIIARYSGYGDSGGIDEWDYDEEVNLDNFMGPLEDFVYDFLGRNYGGWEINEGSQGYIEFLPFDEMKPIKSVHINNEERWNTKQFFETKI